MVEEAGTFEVVDSRYLPFSQEQLGEHFLSDPDDHMRPYLDSANRYHDFRRQHGDGDGIPLKEAAYPCQIEKDERFWTATALMTFARSDDAPGNFAQLLERGFGSITDAVGIPSWHECLRGKLRLCLEPTLPSPIGYKRWLQSHLRERQFIPYVLRACRASEGRALEGPTHVDALLLNEDNGFAVFFEAKVLSDISYHVSFDARRNQIARNIDVMLERNEHLGHPLSRRDPDRTLFTLLTPQVFRDEPHSRLYGWLLNDYRSGPASLARDIGHRGQEDWQRVSRRLGWLTWEDCAAVLPHSCPWLPV
jgi:hypothetical protein